MKVYIFQIDTLRLAVYIPSFQIKSTKYTCDILSYHIKSVWYTHPFKATQRGGVSNEDTGAARHPGTVRKAVAFAPHTTSHPEMPFQLQANAPHGSTSLRLFRPPLRNVPPEGRRMLLRPYSIVPPVTGQTAPASAQPPTINRTAA